MNSVRDWLLALRITRGGYAHSDSVVLYLLACNLYSCPFVVLHGLVEISLLELPQQGPTNEVAHKRFASQFSELEA